MIIAISSKFNIFYYIGPILTITCFTIVVYLFRKIRKENIAYLEDLKKNKQQRRFKYLDTFYFSLFCETDDGVYTKFYYLIEDVDSKEKYAICSLNTNRSEKIDNECYGSFWIDEKSNSYFTETAEGKFIDGNKVKKMGAINNNNKLYNESTFNEATFITGYAEFDKRQE